MKTEKFEREKILTLDQTLKDQKRKGNKIRNFKTKKLKKWKSELLKSIIGGFFFN